MKVTVRTLDSKSTTFDVDEDETVKQFKEKVAPQLGIPVERQRVIFKGKVLHDDKLMKDYNVDGCVIHLVQRAPPSSSQAPAAETRNTGTTTQRNSNEDQPSVFIGAFRGANDMTNVTQQLVENLLSTFGGAHGGATVTTSSMGDGTAVNVQINMQAESQNSTPSSDAEQRLQQAQQFLSSARSRLQNLEINSGSSSNMDVDQDPPSQQRNTAQSSDTQSPAAQPPVTSSPQSLANAIKDFQALYNEFEPSLNRYQTLLNNPKSETRSAADDNLPDGIAEIFHNLSHGLHALSDVTFNFHSPEPQTIGSFPRMSPVAMPQSSNLPPSSVPSQSGPSSFPTNTSSTAAQPNVRINPHLHMHEFHQHNPATDASQNGQQNSTTPSSATGQFPNVDFHRPIGVSATVIQIPRFQTSYGMQSASSTTTPATAPTTAQSAANTASSNTAGIPFSLPNLFSTMHQTMSTGMPRVVRPPGASVNAPFSTTNAPMTGGVNTAGRTMPPTSATQTTAQGTPTTQRPFPGLPFNFNPVNPSALVGHPDPLVPCQSFHFGPRFQQEGGHRQIVAEVSSVMIEHMHGGIPSQAATESMSFGNAGPRQDNPSAAPRSTGSTNLPTSAANSQSFFGQNLASNILSSILAQQSLQQQQQQPNAQQSGQAGQREEDQHASDTDEDNDTEDDDLIGVHNTARIYEEVQRAVVGALAGTGDAQTIRQFVESRLSDVRADDATAEEPDDLASQLIATVAEHMTVNDIFQFVLGGSSQPLTRLAPHILQFIETKFNNGERLTTENIPRVTESILEKLHADRETLESLSKRPEVDLPLTLREIDSEFCKEALLLLINRESPSFIEDITKMFKRYLSVVVAVFDECVTGGAEAYIRRYMESEAATRMLASIDPSMLTMFTSMMVSKIRATVQTCPPLSPNELQSRLIKKNQGARPRTELASQATAVEKGEQKEKVDVKKRWEEMNGVVKSDDDDDDDDDGDDDYRIASEYQEWHRHVPPEWISVITKDAKRQRTQSAQKPFSDAYYSGLPAKRRKAIGEARHTDRGVDFNAALQNSIAAANVQPITSQSDLSTDLNQQDLSQAFQDSFRKDARRRLEQDPDYKPSKFPKSHEYFFKK